VDRRRSLPLTQVRLGTGAVGVAPAGHARGSHGARLGLEAFGASIAPEDVEVEGDDDVGVVVLPPLVGVVELAGAFTANWVPVTTVTSAPSATLLGSYAMIAEPERERTTDSAAASVAGAREP
jgi:hypothetical protein